MLSVNFLDEDVAIHTVICILNDSLGITGQKLIKLLTQNVVSVKRQKKRVLTLFWTAQHFKRSGFKVSGKISPPQ